MRELFKALSELETRLMEQYGVSLNEAMALCCIGGDTLTASVISENTGQWIFRVGKLSFKRIA